MQQFRNRHLVFYDGSCGFCDFCVRFILKRDRKKQFVFAPLTGETAERLLKNAPQQIREADSLILIENFEANNERLLVLGKAALRIAWHLGGFWSLLGMISFLPSFLYNWCYKIIARYRKWILSDKACALPKEKEQKRFLP